MYALINLLWMCSCRVMTRMIFFVKSYALDLADDKIYFFSDTIDNVFGYLIG